MPLPCPGDESLAAFLSGKLDPRSRSELEAHLASCAACRELMGALPARSQTPSGGPDTPPHSGAPPPPAFASPKDRYELSTVLGSGGMGYVVKAYDRLLHRTVALKLMRSGEPEQERRFLVEAQAQARLSHEGICRVFDVGELEGQAYIAMQLVEGPTLLAGAGELTLPQKLRVMADVADAIHAAHQAGLVHRDIKPSNVLLERREGSDGRIRAYVADFGLVRDTEAPSSTASGAILGTPQYMAPEQARGDLLHIDARTDVYGLGATLFEVLTGRPPVPGSNKLEVLHQILRGQVPTLRSAEPSLPRDLDAVVSKCLEREPQRRYPTAQALADDLRRVLDGEPTQARPVGPAGRLWKRARRHPRTSALLAAATLLSLGLGLFALRTAWQARARAEAAQRFGQEVAAIEGLMRYSQALPEHDQTQEEEDVRTSLSRLQHEMDALGPAARAPGEYALGRGLLALDDNEGALAHLRRAWDLGLHSNDCAGALARAAGEVYRRELEKLRALPDAALREARRKELQRTLRDPAVAVLRQVEAKAERRRSPMVEALLARYDGRLQDAAQILADVLRAHPLIADAHLVSGSIHEELGSAARDEGRDAQADAEYALAQAAYRRAAEISRSDRRAHEALCQLGFEWGRRALDGRVARAVPELARPALASCEAAIRIGPRHPEAHAAAGGLHRLLAVDLERHGKDPRAEGQLAIAAFERALQLEPDHIAANYQLGTMLRVLGRYQSEHGEDGLPSYRRSAAALERVLHLAPERPQIANALASTLLDAALVDLRHGRDPQAWFARAEPLVDKALRDEPRNANFWMTRGKTAVFRHYWDEQRGRDPGPVLQQALQALEQARQIRGQSLAHYNVASVHELLVERALARGEDPTGPAQKALEHARLAQQLDPKFFHAIGLEGVVLRLLASVAPAGEQARLLARARERQEAALAIEPDSQDAHQELAECALVEARAAAGAGRSAGLAAAVALGEAEARRASALGADQDRPHALVAELWLLQARSLRARGRDARPALQKAREAVQRALAINPERATSLLLLSFIEELDGQAAQAAALRQRAVAIKPDLPLGQAQPPGPPRAKARQ